MTTVTFRLDFRELDRKSGRALRGLTEQVGREATRQIGSPVWRWPNTTPRHNGETAETTRDIVDTGELLTSQSEPIRGVQNPNLYSIVWDADYAAAVFLGAVFTKRSGSLPARNAPLAALRAVNLGEVYAREWE